MDDSLAQHTHAAESLQQQALAAIKAASALSELESIRVAYLGKQGEITALLKGVSQVPAEQRSAYGQAINAAKKSVQHHIQEKKNAIETQLQAAQLNEERIDVTMPGSCHAVGSLHPITQTIRFLRQVFHHYGFVEVDGSEVEDDFHNFTALNIGPTHPARAMHDTFYFQGDRLLRTHTSPAQIHTMEHQAPPLRIMSLGKVYRCDSDPTHSPMFHQLEGLVVSEIATMVDLKTLLDQFFTAFFGEGVQVRFRPSYFPFTEPSCEVDIKMPGGDSWLEVMGCGMVHPEVFRQVGIDTQRYRGYAFGVGIDRLAMLRYGIQDLRHFFENDIDFLRQF
jgi:phenylalanyl-tRNA synthetase alpha chain